MDSDVYYLFIHYTHKSAKHAFYCRELRQIYCLSIVRGNKQLNVCLVNVVIQY